MTDSTFRLTIHWTARILSLVCVVGLILFFDLGTSHVPAQTTQNEQDRTISRLSEVALTTQQKLDQLYVIVEKNEKRSEENRNSIVELREALSSAKGVGVGLGMALLILQIAQVVTERGGIKRGRTS